MIHRQIFSSCSNSGNFEALADSNRSFKFYADIPHRFFGDLQALKDYIVELKKLGVNVALLLPHFKPSFSEYVVSSYEEPCSFFGSWEAFAGFMSFVEDVGMDRMVDIPFNHADWQAENLSRSWFVEHEKNGLEAGADDVDANGKRIRVNWGAFVLDNSNTELQQYWLEKIIFPHITDYNVNCIRIDAAWGLSADGLKTIVGKTLENYPDTWFLAENLGMDRLIDLAETSIEAGVQRFFNNLYWHSGGRYIPSDIYRFFKRSGGLPTASIFSSHDTLMPAMKALALLRPKTLGTMNDKALHREVIERQKVKGVGGLPQGFQEKIPRLMKLDFILAALSATDLMFVAGSEKLLLERVNVMKSGPEEFSQGVETDLPDFIRQVIRIKASNSLFASEGIIVPFGHWKLSRTGAKGFVKTVGEEILYVAVNTSLTETVQSPVPQRLKTSHDLYEYSTDGRVAFEADLLGETITLGPGQAVIVTGTIA